MQTINIAIIEELQKLKEKYPLVGYKYGQDDEDFDHLIVLDFTQATDLQEDGDFNGFLKGIKHRLIQKFNNHWVIFFFEEVNYIKTIFDIYSPALTSILKQNKITETPIIETDLLQTTAKPYAIAA